MNLQPLFAGPILEQVAMDPGYSGHASDVWLVRTAAEAVVVRASRMAGDLENDFWWGARSLFGIDPRRVFDMAAVNGCLSGLSSIPVPRVLRKGLLGGRQHVVVELLPGRPLKSFVGQPAAMLEGLGEARRWPAFTAVGLTTVAHLRGRCAMRPASFMPGWQGPCGSWWPGSTRATHGRRPSWSRCVRRRWRCRRRRLAPWSWWIWTPRSF